MTTRVTDGAKSEQAPTRWTYTFSYIELALNKGGIFFFAEFKSFQLTLRVA